MAGLYSLQMDSTKNISLGQLDQFLDFVATEQGGIMRPADVLKVALSFRCIDMIAGAVSRMPYCIYRGEDDVTDEYTPRYFSDLLYRLCESYLVFNAAYTLLETNQYGANGQWRFLVTPAMQIKTDPTSNQLTGFTYNNQDITDYEKRLLWWWWPNILSEVGPGTGPTSAALDDIALVKYLTDFAKAYFLRGGFPVTLLQMDGPITKDEQEKLESFWTSMVNGVKRAFRAVLITSKIKPTQIGSNIKDTIAPELYTQSARNTAIAYGIPFSMLMSDAANYATANQDTINFYENTVLPLYNRLIMVWNERVFVPQGVELFDEHEQLECYQRAEVEKAQALVSLVGNKPILTVNEARDMLGYDPMEEDDMPEPEDMVQPDMVTPDVEDSVDDDEIETEPVDEERAKLKRYAHNRLTDGKPFKFHSNTIPLADIEAVKMCKTHDAIDAVVFDKHDIGMDILAALNEAIKLAREVKA